MLDGIGFILRGKMMKKISFSFALLFSLSANAALTDPQAQTLAAHIRANADPAVVAALAQRNDVALADYYNGPGSCVVWRTAVQPTEYREAVVWTAVDGLTAGKARIWQWITADMTLPIDATRANIRQGIADAWGGGSATGVALTALAKRTASKAENLFTTGTCTTGTPGLLGWEGPLHVNDVSNTLNRY